MIITGCGDRGDGDALAASPSPLIVVGATGRSPQRWQPMAPLITVMAIIMALAMRWRHRQRR